MNYLFLDTCSSRVIISFIKDNKIIFNVNEKNDNNLSSKLMVLIDDSFKKNNIKPTDIHKIFVANGPGSFTGIRCGVTVAKTLAFLLSVPIVGISELEVMASGYNYPVCPIIDARRGYVYGAIYDGVSVIKGDCYISYDELIKNIDCKVVSYDNYENALEPKVDIFKLIKKHEKETIDPHLLVPNYLKKTEAEENLNAKRN